MTINSSLEELGADSLDRLQLAIDIDIPFDRVPNLLTVGDLVAEVEGISAIAA